MEERKKCHIFAFTKLKLMEPDKKKEFIKDFDLYLQKFQCVNANSRGNYLSWTRFLIEIHDLEALRTNDDVKKILRFEQALQQLSDRTKYKTEKDLCNFRATLNRLLPFVKIWNAKQEELKKQHSFDEMIDQIDMQACAEHARTMFEAIVLRAYQMQYVFSNEQMLRMKQSLAKFDCRVKVDKFFMPGVNYNLNSSI